MDDPPYGSLPGADREQASQPEASRGQEHRPEPQRHLSVGDATFARGTAAALIDEVGRSGVQRVLLVTGMSGAGRSTTLRLLEDIGYEAVDNLPLSLLGRLLRGGGTAQRPVAVGIDVRTRDFEPDALAREVLRLGQEEQVDVRLIFLDCEDELLGRRYTETRRRHPLAGDRPVMDGIRLERRRLAALRSLADTVIDTTAMKPAELKLLLQGQFGGDQAGRLSLFVTSFSFRQGLPREADLVFDVRFLDNPHYHADLRPLTGRDATVGAHIATDPAFQPFIASLKQLLLPLLPRYAREGKSYLTIAIGCTGGRHRSVYVAELLSAWLSQNGQRVSLSHRDLPSRHGHTAGDTAFGRQEQSAMDEGIAAKAVETA